MIIKDWIDRLLDATIIFSFDRTGFKRHCKDPLESIDLSHQHAIVTGASSGIGLAAAKGLLKQGMSCDLIGRNVEKLENNYKTDSLISGSKFYSLDMSDLKAVYAFAKDQVTTAVDLLIHNAGSMPSALSITQDGYEEMFASQVLAPFILTKTLIELGKLKKGCRIILVSSGGMYTQKLDLSDLDFTKKSYNKYTGYANAKRAQVILNELFSEKYPQYLFSAMHPGWADTPGVRLSMPLFYKILKNRLRTSEEGADTLLFLATHPDYPNGKFWFDRKQAKTTIGNYNKSSQIEEEELWNYCESVFNKIKS